MEAGLRRDQLIALMVAELDARLHGRGEVTVLQWSDEANRRSEAVELLASDEGGQLVVEHTLIESFERQTEEFHRLLKIFPRGGPYLEGCWKAAYMRLSIRQGDLLRVDFNERARVAEVLTEWAAATIDTVPPPHAPGRSKLVTGTHDDVPFSWSMYQVLSFDVATLMEPWAWVMPVSIHVDGSLEDLRTERLGRALSAKLPKLHTASDGHRRSILVVEDKDVVFSAPLYVASAMKAASSDHRLPDVIYFLDTGHGNPTALTLYESGAWAHDSDVLFDRHSFPNERCSQLNWMVD